MKIVLILVTLLLMFPTLVFSSTRFLCGSEWREVGVWPEQVYQEFIARPKTSVGIIDALLHRDRPQDGLVMIMGDLRDNIAVLFFRGVPGGTGFAIPEDWLYKYREYVLEIRWLDHVGRWHYWWNHEKLDDTFLARPELCPMASNAPF